MNNPPLIELRDLSFSHAGEQTLAHIDLSVAASEFIAVIGPSGCGKSTLLRLVGGLLMPSSGEVLVGGKNVTGPGLDRAMVFQDYSLFPWSTCADNKSWYKFCYCGKKEKLDRFQRRTNDRRRGFKTTVYRLCGKSCRR